MYRVSYCIVYVMYTQSSNRYLSNRHYLIHTDIHFFYLVMVHHLCRYDVTNIQESALFSNMGVLFGNVRLAMPNRQHLNVYLYHNRRCFDRLDNSMCLLLTQQHTD